MSQKDIELAIAYIEDDIRIHKQWAAWLPSLCGEEKKAAESNAGNVEHHLEWVRRYEHVLKVINERILSEH